MADIEQRSTIGKTIDWLTEQLPSRTTMAATAILGLGWGLEYSGKSDRVELGAFGATAKTDVVHNSGWDARLKECSLMVSEPGKYTAEVLRDGKAIQTQQFSVSHEPAFVQFKNIEPRGGLGSVLSLGGDPLNFGYGYSNHAYEIRVSNEREGSASTVVSKKI